MCRKICHGMTVRWENPVNAAIYQESSMKTQALDEVKKQVTNAINT